jgi:hypothetical protein
VDFYFPDSQDQIDPFFDFDQDEHLPFHVRQRDDLYAHEVHEAPPYDGILISKTMVDGYGSGGRYTAAQRHRLHRLGVREFFRLSKDLKVIGDCGGFSYVNEHVPPVTVADTIDFYDGVGVDEGISVDHVILGYDAGLDDGGDIPPEWLERQAITLELAAEFFAEHERRGSRFTPMGAAQGWSPKSFAASVERLQEIGYRRIALGGMVPLKAMQIISCLEAVRAVRRRGTSLHLLGISRTEHYATFRSLGVKSLDSTSPFRQAFKDDKDNYYTPGGRNYVALRIPPSESNAKLQARIRAGHLDQATVRAAEDVALAAVRAYSAGSETLNNTLKALLDYEVIHGKAGRRDHAGVYRDFLAARPWLRCPCAVCKRWGVEVAIFRGTERNKRRGFHNLWVFHETMQGHIAGSPVQAWNDTEDVGEAA